MPDVKVTSDEKFSELTTVIKTVKIPYQRRKERIYLHSLVNGLPNFLLPLRYPPSGPALDTFYNIFFYHRINPVSLRRR